MLTTYLRYLKLEIIRSRINISVAAIRKARVQLAYSLVEQTIDTWCRYRQKNRDNLLYKYKHTVTYIDMETYRLMNIL